MKTGQRASVPLTEAAHMTVLVVVAVHPPRSVPSSSSTRLKKATQIITYS